MEELSNELNQKLEELSDEVEQELFERLEIYYKLVEFGNWLDEGVKTTDDPMLKRVLENYALFFADYIKQEDTADEPKEND